MRAVNLRSARNLSDGGAGGPARCPRPPSGADPGSASSCSSYLRTAQRAGAGVAVMHARRAGKGSLVGIRGPGLPCPNHPALDGSFLCVHSTPTQPHPFLMPPSPHTHTHTHNPLRTAATGSSWHRCASQSVPAPPPGSCPGPPQLPPRQSPTSTGCPRPSPRRRRGGRCAAPAVVPRWAGPRGPARRSSSLGAPPRRAALPAAPAAAAALQGPPAAGSCKGRSGQGRTPSSLARKGQGMQGLPALCPSKLQHKKSSGDLGAPCPAHLLVKKPTEPYPPYTSPASCSSGAASQGSYSRLPLKVRTARPGRGGRVVGGGAGRGW
jgi:hypothetical protein